jgi:DNA replication protein DnaC
LARKRLAASGIPNTRAEKTLASFKLDGVSTTVRAAYKAAKGLLVGDGPPWLCLTGPKGCGKTHLGYSLCIAKAKGGWKVQYMTALRLGNLLHASLDEDEENPVSQLVNFYSQVDLLCLDEVAQSSSSNWVVGLIDGILGQRYEAALPTVILSNLMPSDLEEVSGRLYSRLCDQSVCQWVDMIDAQDYRPRLQR